MKRIWNVRLNIDSWNAGLAELENDAERLSFVVGFNTGVNGKPFLEKGTAWLAGWKVGNSAHAEAIIFGEKQRANALKREYGNAMAMPRHEYGNAMAMPNNNLQSTIIQSTIIQPKEVANAPRKKKSISPELECVKRHTFRIKGTILDKKNALMEIIQRVGIEETDRQMGELKNVWASDVCDMVKRPSPSDDHEIDNEAEQFAKWTEIADAAIAQAAAGKTT